MTLHARLAQRDPNKAYIGNTYGNIPNPQISATNGFVGSHVAVWPDSARVMRSYAYLKILKKINVEI